MDPLELVRSSVLVGLWLWWVFVDRTTPKNNTFFSCCCFFLLVWVSEWSDSASEEQPEVDYQSHLL